MCKLTVLPFCVIQNLATCSQSHMHPLLKPLKDKKHSWTISDFSLLIHKLWINKRKPEQSVDLFNMHETEPFHPTRRSLFCCLFLFQLYMLLQAIYLITISDCKGLYMVMWICLSLTVNTSLTFWVKWGKQESWPSLI